VVTVWQGKDDDHDNKGTYTAGGGRVRTEDVGRTFYGMAMGGGQHFITCAATGGEKEILDHSICVNMHKTPSLAMTR